MDWSTLFSSFGLVLIAELGDKTQLAIITQTCKYGRPLPVFLGGSLALTAVTALGVVGGQVAGNLIPEMIIRVIAALTFVIIGIFVWRESLQSDTAEEDVCDDERMSQASSTRHSLWNWKAFGSTLSLLFIAELGDKTQLAVLGLSSKQSTPWVVFVGGALALTIISALGVIGGQQLYKHIPERILLKISAVSFVVMGLLMGLNIL